MNTILHHFLLRWTVHFTDRLMLESTCENHWIYQRLIRLVALNLLNKSNLQREPDFRPLAVWHVIGKQYCPGLFSLWCGKDSDFKHFCHRSSIVPWTFAWENYKSTGTIRVLKLHVLFQTENTIGLPCKRHNALNQPVYTCVSFPHSLCAPLYGTDKKSGEKLSGHSAANPLSQLVHISLCAAKCEERCAFIWLRQNLG